MEEQRKKRFFPPPSLIKGWERELSCWTALLRCLPRGGWRVVGGQGPMEEGYGGSACCWHWEHHAHHRATCIFLLCCPGSSLAPLCSSEMLPQQSLQGGRLVGIPLHPHTSLLPLGGGEGLAAGSRCVSSAPSRTLPAPRFVVWLERHCCWMGTGAVLPGTACSVAAALLLVADAARSPLQAANWVLLNTFPKPKSGPRMVATSHCLDLMIGLVQQVRGCWGSVHPVGLGQDPGGVRDALTPLAENGLSADGCGVGAQIWGGG